MGTSSETPNEGERIQHRGHGEKGKERWAVYMEGYKDGEGEEMESGKRGEKKRKGEAKEMIMAVLGVPAKQPCNWATVPGVGEESHRSSDQTSCRLWSQGTQVLCLPW